jgi:hypothetical protein
MSVPNEWAIQRALWIWFAGKRYPKRHLRAGEWQIVPAALPDVIGWHTPNGGARSAVEGARFQEIGVVPGIFDLTFLRASRFYILELKDETGRLSPAQLTMWARYEAAGAAGIAWANSLEGAKTQIRTWGLVVC